MRIVITPETLTVPTSDGVVLTARLFPPPAPATGAVLIVSAMGVTQSFYAALATWLAAQGYLVATFDYRGVGASRQGGLRQVDATIEDWARFDCGAVLEALAARLPDRPLFWIGHSLGGQILPFVPNTARITRAITIASGSGYWRENVPALRWRAWWLWYVAVPIAVRLFGYFPGRRMGKVGDLPRGVIEQWRRWCLDPEYAIGAEGPVVRARYAAVQLPLVSLSFSDDEFMSAANIASLHGFYTRAAKVMLRIAPADIGVPRIGHFGFFRPRFETALWRDYLLPALL